MPETPDIKLKRNHLEIIEKYGGDNAGKILATIAAAQLTFPLAKQGYAWLKRHEDYTITVGGTDDLYPDLHEWVLARIPEVERKAMIASTGEEGLGYYDVDPDEALPYPPVRLRYDGSRVQEVIIDHNKVLVEVSQDDLKGGLSSDKLPENWRRLVEKITFTAETAKGRDAVLQMMDGLQRAKHEKNEPPPLLVPARWGGSWNKRNELPPRTLDSVILKDGQIEDLIRDLDVFLASEETYARASQPWHRGMLFYGEPGTGKTSIARALANHFDMPIYYLPLGDLEKDADLMSLMLNIKPKSILLLEDVDVFHAATDRDDEEGTTIASLLNAIDGIWTPHGLVTIMTTNHKESLDDALIRAGRVDVDMEFTALDEDQAIRLAQFITQDSSYDTLASKFVDRSPADLIKKLRKKQQKELLACSKHSSKELKTVASGPSSSPALHSVSSPRRSRDSTVRLTSQSG